MHKDLDTKRKIYDKLVKVDAQRIEKLERTTTLFEEIETLARPETSLDKAPEFKALLEKNEDSEELKLLD
jgi:hypothetical protein